MKTYLCFLEHFATGEGMIHCIAAVHAENEENAKKAFIRKHICNEMPTEDNTKECVSYFSHGAILYDIGDETQHAKVKSIMKDFFTEGNIEHMFHANKAGALIDFYYKSYANYS